MMKIQSVPENGTIFSNHQTPHLVYFAHSALGSKETSRHMHTHDQITEVIYIKSGIGKHMINGQMYFSKPGDILIYYPGVLHEEYAADDIVEELCCGFKNIHIKTLKSGFMGNPKQILIPHQQGTEIIGSLMASIELTLSQKTMHYSELCKTLGTALIVHLHALLKEHLESPADVTSSVRSVGKMLREYIDVHFSEDLSLLDIAQKFNISPSYASRIFQKENGCSFVQYRLKRRIGEAETLLTETDYPISYIASSVGFDNVSYFSQAFSKINGQSPSEYRYTSVGNSPIFKNK